MTTLTLDDIEAEWKPFPPFAASGKCRCIRFSSIDFALRYVRVLSSKRSRRVSSG
jgi:hypothetical protein